VVSSRKLWLLGVIRVKFDRRVELGGGLNNSLGRVSCPRGSASLSLRFFEPVFRRLAGGGRFAPLFRAGFSD
jgi:hypothetical protein